MTLSRGTMVSHTPQRTEIVATVPLVTAPPSTTERGGMVIPSNQISTGNTI